MGFQERTVGGGPAKGLGKDFTAFLQDFINTGSFGGGTAGQQTAAGDPTGRTGNIFDLLNSIVSNPQADASVQELIRNDITRGRNDLRSRFGAGGGMGYGTPAAFAEGLYQAEQAPRTAMAMDQMAQQRLASLLPLFGFARDISSIGIPQAQAALEPKPWLQGVNLGLDIVNTAAKFIPGGGGGDTTRSTAANSISMGAPRSVTPINPGARLSQLDEWARNYDPTLSGMNFMPFPTQQVYR